ncbi:TIGR00730 family Rossman fold protein [Sphingomonas sp. SCN 67-18]|uniref:LOG family protein n=1 Tax=uncultured Sphingomonas sp. TaxID=158754 RepID=UPI0025DCED82|nr:TIGR00730 family Rossman fold protein [Sphingomonas sp. SCN 67-18]
MRLAIYCGSSMGADPAYAEAATAAARTLAERGIGVVYGGGRLGLMGLVADAALAAGGEVIGVIPDTLVQAEVAHTGCTELHVVDTMHQRKQMMTDLCDGFIALPGGVGTMDELFEAMSWAVLGYHRKPCGLLNVGGYYDKLIAFVDEMGEAGFIRQRHRGNLICTETVEEMLARFADFVPPPTVMEIVREDLG